jgi:putative protease
MAEQEIGFVTHYFDRIGVAVIKLTGGDLKVGDAIHCVGKNDFQQTVVSMQVDHKEIPSAKNGDEVALKLDQPVKEHEKIFKVQPE